MDAMGGPVPDDCSDLAALDQGDRDAGRRLYERHAPLLYALCREETGARSHEDAEDALQETFLRAFRMRDRLTDGGGSRLCWGWFGGVFCTYGGGARGEVLRDAGYAAGHARADTHRGTNAMHPTPTMHAANQAIAAASEPPSRPLERHETLRRLGRAIDELPEDIRLALHLFYLEPDPVAAAKHALGVSRAQFYRLVSQARELIGAKLSREDLQS